VSLRLIGRPRKSDELVTLDCRGTVVGESLEESSPEESDERCLYRVKMGAFASILVLEFLCDWVEFLCDWVHSHELVSCSLLLCCCCLACAVKEDARSEGARLEEEGRPDIEMATSTPDQVLSRVSDHRILPEAEARPEIPSVWLRSLLGSRDRSYWCEPCARTFRSLSALVQHTEARHLGPPIRVLVRTPRALSLRLEVRELR